VLVDRNGRALYLFTRDRAPLSQCYGACAGRWPPFLTKGKPVAGSEARADLLGATRRRDSSSQVTYRGHPLYTDAGSPENGLKRDRKPGDVNGQGFYNWYVVSPAGKAIRKIPHP